MPCRRTASLSSIDPVPAANAEKRGSNRPIPGSILFQMREVSDIKQEAEKEMYRALLFACPATLPFSFAVHPWFVVSDGNTVSRFGVGWQKADSRKQFLFGTHHCTDCRAHMHKDDRPPEEGIAIFPFTKSPVWRGRVFGSIEGDAHSTAARMVRVVQESLHTYPYAEQYSLSGPNSNTYVQWVLNHFPGSGLALPWNAIGKNYAKSR
jgi:hypothetical protein